MLALPRKATRTHNIRIFIIRPLYGLKIAARRNAARVLDIQQDINNRFTQNFVRPPGAADCERPTVILASSNLTVDEAAGSAARNHGCDPRQV